MADEKTERFYDDLNEEIEQYFYITKNPVVVTSIKPDREHLMIKSKWLLKSRIMELYRKEFGS